MKVLVVDTETTGLPYYLDGKRKYPSIVQWSFVVFDMETETVLREHDYIIKALDPIPPETTAIHGITEEMSQSGFDFRDVYPTYIECVEISNVIIGHNIDFDMNVMKHQCSRLYLEFQHPNEIFCTAKSSTNICCIERIGKRGKYFKYPKLIELYEFLFNETPTGLHNSMKDVWVCLRCYCQLKQKNIEFLKYKCNS